MPWLARQMKWLMCVSGALTCTMLYAAIAPQAALRSNFGTTLEGPIAEIIVRNWGALIGLVGLLLIYGAFVAPARRLALTVAVLSKVTFIALVLAFGRELLAYQVGTAVMIDAVWVVVFGAYLIGAKHRGPRVPPRPA